MSVVGCVWFGVMDTCRVELWLWGRLPRASRLRLVCSPVTGVLARDSSCHVRLVLVVTSRMPLGLEGYITCQGVSVRVRRR